MPESLTTIQILTGEVVELLKSPAKADKTAAIKTLRRIADVATTLAFTLEAQRPGK